MGQTSSALVQAAAKGELQEVNVLVQKFPYTINQCDQENGWTALHVAAWFGYYAIARELIARHADVHVADKDGRTPLHYAAMKGHAEIVQALLRAGADAYKRDKMGKTPLDHASEQKQHTATMLLQNAPRVTPPMMKPQQQQPGPYGAGDSRETVGLPIPAPASALNRSQEGSLMYPPTVYGTPPTHADPIHSLYPNVPSHAPSPLVQPHAEPYPEVFSNPNVTGLDHEPNIPYMRANMAEPAPGVPRGGLTPWLPMGNQGYTIPPPTYADQIPPPQQYNNIQHAPTTPLPSDHQPPGPYGRVSPSPPAPAANYPEPMPAYPAAPTAPAGSPLDKNPQPSYQHTTPHAASVRGPSAPPLHPANPHYPQVNNTPDNSRLPHMDPHQQGDHAGDLNRPIPTPFAGYGGTVMHSDGPPLAQHEYVPGAHTPTHVDHYTSAPLPPTPPTGSPMGHGRPPTPTPLVGEDDDDWGRVDDDDDWGGERDVVSAPQSAPLAPVDMTNKLQQLNIHNGGEQPGRSPRAESGSLTPWAAALQPEAPPAASTAPPRQDFMVPADGLPKIVSGTPPGSPKHGSGNLGSTSSKKGRRYTYDQLRAATNNFSSKNKIGAGGYGPVYRGIVDGIDVAIKCMDTSDDAMQGLKEFQKEVDILSSIHHPHIVLLIGSCPERGMLVYELMPNGSLDDHLFSPDHPPLLWQDRLRITHQLAAGLVFLHSNDPPVIHMDIKPGNILLDSNFVAKLGDVGLARLVPPSNRQLHSMQDSRLVGTLAYMDPEYMRTGTFSDKSDVYSVGIVMMQLLTGRCNTGTVNMVEETVQRAERDTNAIANIIDRRAGPWPPTEALAFAKLAVPMVRYTRASRPDLKTNVLPALRQLIQQASKYPQSNSAPSVSPAKPPPQQSIAAPTAPPMPGFSRISLLNSTNLPQMFVCPITQDVMDDPVFAADGYTYERYAIQGWLQQHDTSPMTNMALEHKKLTANLALRSSIKEWIQNNTPKH